MPLREKRLPGVYGYEAEAAREAKTKRLATFEDLIRQQGEGREQTRFKERFGMEAGLRKEEAVAGQERWKEQFSMTSQEQEAQAQRALQDWERQFELETGQRASEAEREQQYAIERAKIEEQMQIASEQREIEQREPTRTRARVGTRIGSAEPDKFERQQLLEETRERRKAAAVEEKRIGEDIRTAEQADEALQLIISDLKPHIGKKRVTSAGEEYILDTPEEAIRWLEDNIRKLEPSEKRDIFAQDWPRTGVNELTDEVPLGEAPEGFRTRGLTPTGEVTGYERIPEPKEPKERKPRKLTGFEDEPTRPARPGYTWLQNPDGSWSEKPATRFSPREPKETAAERRAAVRREKQQKATEERILDRWYTREKGDEAGKQIHIFKKDKPRAERDMKQVNKIYKETGYDQRLKLRLIDVWGKDYYVVDFVPVGGGGAAPTQRTVAPAGERVRVQSPDGTIGNLPANEVEDALRAGYTRI